MCLTAKCSLSKADTSGQEGSFKPHMKIRLSILPAKLIMSGIFSSTHAAMTRYRFRRTAALHGPAVDLLVHQML
jgi:hypothetical protein